MENVWGAREIRALVLFIVALVIAAATVGYAIGDTNRARSMARTSSGHRTEVETVPTPTTLQPSPAEAKTIRPR